MRTASPIKLRSAVRELIPQNSLTSSLSFPITHNKQTNKSRSTPTKKSKDDIIRIKQENYKLTQQCQSQCKTIKLLEQRIIELKTENDKLKIDKDLQEQVVKKLKAKFLYVPASEVLSKQCIELKSKVDLYKSKYNQIRKQYIKARKDNKSFKQQLNNTNTALHNILSKKYVILNNSNQISKNQNDSVSPPNSKSNVCFVFIFFVFPNKQTFVFEYEYNRAHRRVQLR